MKLPSSRFIATLALTVALLEGIIWLARGQPPTSTVLIVPERGEYAVVSSGNGVTIIRTSTELRKTFSPDRDSAPQILFPISDEPNGANELSATRLDTTGADGTFAPFRIVPSFPSATEQTN